MVVVDAEARKGKGLEGYLRVMVEDSIGHTGVLLSNMRVGSGGPSTWGTRWRKQGEWNSSM